MPLQSAEPLDYWQFLSQSHFRFYQQRDLGLDLYHSGFPGILLAVVGIASVVVFLLAIFHLIPVKKHVVTLLVSLGGIAGLTGFLASYWNVRHLAEVEKQLIRDTAGPWPVDEGQLAAILALPLVVGFATLIADICGCLYVALFWGGSMIANARRK